MALHSPNQQIKTEAEKFLDDANGTNAGLRGRKGDMWEGGIRVPAIIEWPARIKIPAVTEVPAGVIDIYPTLVDILQLDRHHAALVLLIERQVGIGLVHA